MEGTENWRTSIPLKTVEKQKEPERIITPCDNEVDPDSEGEKGEEQEDDSEI